MNRREFLQNTLAATGAAALTACGVKSGSNEIQVGEMTCRTTPSTGDKVSLLGYGMMRLPKLTDEEQIKKAGSDLDQEMINALVDRAMEAGVNYYDTSPAYCQGHSETATGIALARHDRSKWLVATKLSNFSPESWSREASMRMYESSFKNLQVDVIDYYLLHSVGSSMENLKARYIDNGMLDFLVEERAKGRIRNLGFSFHGDVAVFDYMMSLHDKYKWDFVQIQMNYVDWNNAKTVNPRNVNASYLYDELQKRGIPATIMEPLLGGRLANVPEHIADRMLEQEPSRSIASWAFRFCGTYPGVLTALSGMTYMEHLEDNLKSLAPLKPLNDEELAFLESIAEQIASYPSIGCNNCGYCIPCPYGLDIPGIFQHYNKCVNEGYLVSDEMDPEYRKARRNYLNSYAKAIVPARQADKCIGCGQCVDKCPQRIDIPRQLRKIDRYVEKLRQNE